MMTIIVITMKMMKIMKMIIKMIMIKIMIMINKRVMIILSKVLKFLKMLKNKTISMMNK